MTGFATIEATAPPSTRLSPGEWVRKRLFNNWYNSLLTIVLGLFLPLVAVFGYLALALFLLLPLRLGR